VTACSAPDIPPDLWIQQGWRESERGVWLKADGTPVFFVDLVKAYKPLADWCREMARLPEPTLADFEASDG
jgi:hypothetical protein